MYHTNHSIKVGDSEELNEYSHMIKVLIIDEADEFIINNKYLNTAQG